MTTIRCLLCAAGFIGFVGTTAADTVMIVSDKDNTLIQEASGAVSNGAGGFLFAGLTGPQAGTTIRRGLIAFDVAANIPSGSIINSATLQLTLDNPAAHGAQTITLTKVLADWGEGTSSSTGGAGGPSTPNDATWIHRLFNTAFWTNAGGDFVGASSASLVVNANGPYSWGSTAQMVADVQGWLDNPASSFGWIIRGNETTSNTVLRFGTRENSAPADRPVLTVDFTPPAPAISQLGVLAALLVTLIAGVGVLRLRKPLIPATVPVKSSRGR